MAKQRGKSSAASAGKSASASAGSGSGKGDGWSAKDFVRSRLKQPLRDPPRRRVAEPVPATDGEALLTKLKDMEDGATAAQLAAAIGGDAHGRELAVTLRRLVEQGRVLEVRPGRYQVSGTDGEFSVILEDEEGDTGGVLARFPDGRVLPVNRNYLIGAGPGDVAQAMIGEDGLVLITRILRRSGREVVGTVNFKPGGLVLICDNRREGELPVLGTFKGFSDAYQAGKRVVGTVEVDPTGAAGVHLTRILSDESPEITDFRYVCLVHDLPGEFPEAVVAQAKAYQDSFPLGDREDLRQKLVYTIDPATAKDFDDAISLEQDAQGRWVLGVHIADVSHYVTQHSPLDQEAAQRATSCYLINRVIPMLPENLSNGLCSLVPHRDRYCLSAFLTLDKNLKLVDTRLAETLINSRHRFTYEEALDVLEGRAGHGTSGKQWPADVTQVLKQTSDIAQGLRRAREKAGALNLFSVEHRFQLDVNGMPTGVAHETTDISHQLIEECMLLANRAVASWLEKHDTPCVYRIHEEPDPERIKLFAHLLEVYGLDSSRVQNRFGLQKLLADLAKEPPAARLVLNLLCLRSFKKAVYSIDNIGHYALAFDSYCHFTSPIRRYPDLLVHRLVKLVLGLPGYKDTEQRRGYLDALARQSSNLEQRAENAERDLHARKATRFLAARIGEEFEAVVTGATPGGLTVQLIETGMDGFVPLRELKDDFYSYDAERFALIGKRSGRVLGIGEQLDVLVASADIDRSDVVLGLVSSHQLTRRIQADGESSRYTGGKRPETKRTTRREHPPRRQEHDAKRAARLAKQQAKREERKQRRLERLAKQKRKGR
jgi:ribonuclease R